jgi:hypothetical protein
VFRQLTAANPTGKTSYRVEVMFPHLTARLWILTLSLTMVTALISGVQAQDGYSGGSQYDVYREAPDPDANADESRYGTPTQGQSYQRPNDDYYPAPSQGRGGNNQAYRPDGGAPANDAYRPPQGGARDGYGAGGAYNDGPSNGGRDFRDQGGYNNGPGRYADEDEPYEDRAPRRYSDEGGDSGTYSQGEILDAGHSFFGSLSKGLANVVEYAFKQSGRPNGYILGEDAGGAFVAGLRYGEGRLHTRFAGTHKVYWQGPSIGYDFGAEGSKTMVLVYNLRDPSEIFNRFGGVQGSAYIIGGVGIQFQTHGDVTLAPIRTGIGLRLGANIGYLKYTRTPTWNPF